MIKRISNKGKISVVLAAGLVTACSAVAQDMDSATSGNATGFYESFDVGVAFMQDMGFRTAELSGTSLQFDAGPRFDLSLGYNITKNVAVEVQGGFAYNTASFTDTFAPTGFSSDVWTVPVMVNGIYKYPINDHWQVYGGVGAGAVISTWNLSESSGATFNLESTDCEFGYQAMLGVKYHLTDHLDCGLGYNFLGSLDHHWGMFGTGITAKPTYMHSILASLTYKF